MNEVFCVFVNIENAQPTTTNVYVLLSLMFCSCGIYTPIHTKSEVENLFSHLHVDLMAIVTFNASSCLNRAYRCFRDSENETIMNVNTDINTVLRP